MCETSQKHQLQGRTSSSHTVSGLSYINRSQCTVSHSVVRASCSYGALCGSCCYFKRTPVRLTAGCQRLLSVILCPLFGLCDCNPAGGERSRLHSLLWICLDVWSVEMSLTCQLQPSPAEFGFSYFWTSNYDSNESTQSQWWHNLLRKSLNSSKELRREWGRNQICLNLKTFKTEPYPKQPGLDSL